MCKLLRFAAPPFRVRSWQTLHSNCRSGIIDLGIHFRAIFRVFGDGCLDRSWGGKRNFYIRSQGMLRLGILYGCVYDVLC